MSMPSFVAGTHSTGVALCRERYFVASGHGGGWLVFREGNSRAIRRIPGKKEAVQTAKILARCNSPSQVLVENRNGSFLLTFDFDHTNKVRGY